MMNDNQWDNGTLGRDEEFVQASADSAQLDENIDDAIGMNSVMIRLDNEVLARLKEIASQEGLHVKALIRTALSDYVKNKQVSPTQDGRLNSLRFLQDAVTQIEQWCHTANEAKTSGDDAWHVVFKAIFSGQFVSDTRKHLENLGLEVDYYDPDTSYKDDIMAYLDFLRGQVYRATQIFQVKRKVGF